MKNKVYISGPITGHDKQEVAQRFEAAKKLFQNTEYKPISPLENGLPASATYEEHMFRDLEMLAECEAIFMLKGWERSKGCKIEFGFAMSNKITIIFEQ